MFGSQVLDVAIGMILVYLLLSLICSAVNEIIEAWLKKRATDLERGIRELLQDRTGKGVVKQLYSHPLVSGLYRGDYKNEELDHKSGPWKRLREFVTRTKVDESGRWSTYRLRGLLLNRSGSDLPSYIPSRNFALAMIDLVLRPETPAETPSPTSPPISPPVSPPAGASAGNYTIGDLRAALNAFPDANVRRALLALVDEAGDDIKKARANIEKWFDSAMDRVSGLYKRRTQVIILCIGFGVAVFVNADTVAIFKSLMNDPAQRNSLVEAATEYAKPNQAPAANAPTPTPTPSPSTSSGATPATTPNIPEACQKDPNSPECRVQRNLGEIKKLGLPIGWDCADTRAVPQCVRFSPNPLSWVLLKPASWSPWVPKLIGWLLTAIALSLGAPFWFDLLNKFMVVRSTVKPREKSPEEKPVG